MPRDILNETIELVGSVLINRYNVAVVNGLFVTWKKISKSRIPLYESSLDIQV